MTDWVSSWNYLEAGIWACISVVFLIKAARSREPRRHSLGFLGVVFLVFGVTDVVEAHTGAWWQPWWLAVWKGACLAMLAWGFRRLYAGRPR